MSEIRHKGKVLVVGSKNSDGEYVDWVMDGLGKAIAVEIVDGKTYLCGYSADELDAMMDAEPKPKQAQNNF